MFHQHAHHFDIMPLVVSLVDKTLNPIPELTLPAEASQLGEEKLIVNGNAPLVNAPPWVMRQGHIRKFLLAKKERHLKRNNRSY